jgi:uncharacterized protein (UPF0218 family)
MLYTRKLIKSGSFAASIREPGLVVTVGDRVTETVAGLGRVPDVQVVDGKENRRERIPPDVSHKVSISVHNPPGTITAEAITGLKQAFKGKKPVRVMVTGEEDLLAIPAQIFAPVGARIYYGQPGEGIVLLRVDRAAKIRGRELLKEMGGPDAGETQRT